MKVVEARTANEACSCVMRERGLRPVPFCGCDTGGDYAAFILRDEDGGRYIVRARRLRRGQFEVEFLEEEEQ